MVPTVLTIAGSDSSGGAGIQADLKAIAANGGYGASVITAITAQNTREVRRAEPVALDLVAAQLDAVFDDLHVAAVKTGMLATADLVALVADALAARAPRWFVCDPVMVSTSGHALLEPRAAAALADRLFPLATVVTPNSREAAVLAGFPVDDLASAERAGQRLVARGARAVLVKGGHLRDGAGTDLLVDATGTTTIAGTYVDTPHTHGTGCSLASAIATHLVRGLALEPAIRLAKDWLTEAIRHGLEVGGGHGPTDPFFFLRPDVDGAAWLRRLAEPA